MTSLSHQPPEYKLIRKLSSGRIGFFGFVIGSVLLVSCVSTRDTSPVSAQKDVFAQLYAMQQGDASKLQDRAAGNDVHASYLLGLANEYGYGVPQNITDAIKWYIQAAERGHCSAQFRLARKYYVGDDMPQDYVQSRRWHEKLARQGNLYSIQALARFSRYGQGMAKDRDQARHWEDVAERVYQQRPYSMEARAAWESPELACPSLVHGSVFASSPVPIEGVRLGSHDSRVNTLAFSRDGRRVFTASYGDETVLVWDSMRGTKLSEIIVPGDPLNIGSHGERTLVRVPGKRAVPGRIDQGRWVPLPLAKSERIREVFFQSRIEQVEIAGRQFWRDSETGVRLASIPDIKESPTGSSLSPDKKSIVYGGRDGILHVWDVVGNRMQREIATRYPVWTMSVAYSPNGRYVATCGNSLSDGGLTTQRNIRLWDIENGREVRGFLGVDGPIAMAYLVRFTPDGKKLLAAGTDLRNNYVYLYDVESGKELARYTFSESGRGDGQVHDMVVSPDGKQVAVAYGFDAYLFPLR